MNQNKEQQATEPLAKFHVKVTRGGQFTFPYYTRIYYNLNIGDFVELIVRTRKSKLRGFFIARLGDKAGVTIPSEIRTNLRIKQGDIVEIVLIKYYRLQDILGDKVKILEELASKGYKLLTPEEEKQLLLLL
nr:TPA: SpoVT/AbrB family transcriptional regulator [Pyrococcus abyssi GE5]